MKKQRPRLSIGIIFKNDIRSIERCLDALSPLREALPCQLVMADTGSADGSRAVAEKYADIVFDFPWIDDFAAARNAVMDRCAGEWYLSVDTDEYLDRDISELTGFLKAKERRLVDLCRVMVYNYGTYEMDGEYTTLHADRLLRMDTGVRFAGAIHEIVNFAGQPRLCTCNLYQTVFHHDGYVGLGDGRGAGKRKRNLALLEKKIQVEPDNTMARLQRIESSWREPEQLDYVREAVALVEEKKPLWEFAGPAIFRHAVRIAIDRKLPETEAWIQRAERWFPDSPYTRIDVNVYAISYYSELGNYEECRRRGEQCLLDYKAYRAGEMPEVAAGPLTDESRQQETRMQIFMAGLYTKELHEPEHALPILEHIDFAMVEDNSLAKVLLIFRQLQAESTLDLGPQMLRFYESLCLPEPAAEQAHRRRQMFIREASAAFAPEFLRNERRCEDFRRHSYTVFLSLAEKCEIGTAAAILECGECGEMERLLRAVACWDELPIAALEHALLAGVQFPLPDRPMALEAADKLISRMAHRDGPLAELTVRAAERGDGLKLPEQIWTANMALTAVQVCQWEDTERDFALCRAYAKIELARLTACYAPALLCEENIHLLPALYRFGWRCARAFNALDAGDIAGYVRLLREGVSGCEDMRPVAEFLTEHTPQLKNPPPSKELLELAEKVRLLLAGYPADDPALTALKQSEAYRRVAHLIEERKGAARADACEAGLTPDILKNALSSYPAMSEMLKTYGYQDILEQTAALGRLDLAAMEAYPMGGYSKGMTSGAYRFVL